MNANFEVEENTEFEFLMHQFCLKFWENLFNSQLALHLENLNLFSGHDILYLYHILKVLIL